MRSVLPPAVPPLSEALRQLRMSGTFYCRTELSAPWGLAIPPMRESLSFHAVAAGACLIETGESGPRRLGTGDLAIVPHGGGHVLRSEPDAFAAKLFDLPREAVSERYEILRHGGGGEAALVICGAVRFDDPAARHLVSLLPPLLVVESGGSASAEWLRVTMRLIETEARTLRPGAETVITRVADILVIQAIRTWLEEDPAARTGWLGAMQDRQIGRALALIHRDPQHPWTLEMLARHAAMSRSAFAARFAELLGEPAMRYLTRWRMRLAESALRDEPQVGIAELAARLGYESEAAFSRAFKRVTGRSPGAARSRVTDIPMPMPGPAPGLGRGAGS